MKKLLPVLLILFFVSGCTASNQNLSSQQKDLPEALLSIGMAAVIGAASFAIGLDSPAQIAGYAFDTFTTAADELPIPDSSSSDTNPPNVHKRELERLGN
jgi:hypothetical protein